MQLGIDYGFSGNQLTIKERSSDYETRHAAYTNHPSPYEYKKIRYVSKQVVDCIRSGRNLTMVEPARKMSLINNSQIDGQHPNNINSNKGPTIWTNLEILIIIHLELKCNLGQFDIWQAAWLLD